MEQNFQTSEGIDEIGLEAIAEKQHQLIHNDIPSLAFGSAIGEIANVEE